MRDTALELQSVDQKANEERIVQNNVLAEHQVDLTTSEAIFCVLTIFGANVFLSKCFKNHWRFQLIPTDFDSVDQLKMLV